MFPLCILSNIRVKLALHSSLEDKIVKNYLYLSKLKAQMVTSTPSENLSLQFYEAQNKTFKFGTTKTLILHTRSVFFIGDHLTKIWSKKIFFMKTLSKLGALTVSHYTVQYVAFLRSAQNFGTYSLAESLFPVGPLLWKALWRSR
jgi:hypothetical protein